MADDELRALSLEELAEGAIGERWDYEFGRLIENALDPNRDAEAKRVITLKITLQPNEKRNGGRMDFTVVPNLAPLSKISEPIHFGRHADTGLPVAVRSDPQQLHMFRDNSDATVLPLNSKQGAD